jgi:hypothetical protein
MSYNGAWLGLFIIAAVYLAWRDSMRARERAIAVCRDVCARHDVQFLDQTVALARLGLCRNGGRGLRLRRVYEFEFSAEGQTRSSGSITVVSDRVDAVYLPGITDYLEH